MPSIVNATTTAGVAVSGDNSGVLALQTNNGTTAVTIDTSQNVGIGNTVASTLDAVSASGNLVVGSGSGNEGLSVYSGTAGLGSLCFADGTTTTSTYTGYITYNHSSNHMEFGTNGGTERMRIDSSGNVGIGTTTPNSFNAAADNLVVGTTSGNNGITIAGGTTGFSSIYMADGTTGNEAYRGYIEYRHADDAMAFGTSASERMRIANNGTFLVAKTAEDGGTPGFEARPSGIVLITRNADLALYINRTGNDGTLVTFRQDNTEEGTISVSGSTVSYNGGHLSRWSQLPDNSKDDTILKGTVLTNLDDMCVWTKDGTILDNEQLNKMKVSDVEGDTNVAGVFVNWTRDEDCNSDDMNVAMTGDMIIRIAEGVVVQKGDLLMSAGDGTAKPQGDDIRRSKTVAKVTSNHVTCTYADGSYCVPCVLMAC